MSLAYQYQRIIDAADVIAESSRAVLEEEGGLLETNPLKLLFIECDLRYCITACERAKNRAIERRDELVPYMADGTAAPDKAEEEE